MLQYVDKNSTRSSSIATPFATSLTRSPVYFYYNKPCILLLQQALYILITTKYTGSLNDTKFCFHSYIRIEIITTLVSIFNCQNFKKNWNISKSVRYRNLVVLIKLPKNF